MLRCVQLGISVRDLDLLTVGMVEDMCAERMNDECDYPIMATQGDFNSF